MVPSFILMIWLGIASQMAKSQGFVHNQMKSLSIENCTFNMNLTMTVSDSGSDTEQYWLFIFFMYHHFMMIFKNDFLCYKRNDFSVLVKISYLWYTCIGAVIVLILGTLSSWISGAQDASLLDPRLAFRFLRNRVGKNRVSYSHSMIGITKKIIIFSLFWIKYLFTLVYISISRRIHWN